MFSKYELKARVFPAIITIFPILIFSHFYLYKIIPKLLNSILSTQIIGDISIIVVFIYIVMQISRFVSKRFLQDSIFKNELYFPTTSFLLYSDEKYSKEYKEKIRQKISEDFKIVLISQNEENNNIEEARKKINEAVKMIRNRVKNGRLLLQHNIEYGFVRNLIGGTIISFPFSIFNIFFFVVQQNKIAIIISIILLLFYSIIGFSQKIILKYFANNYADVLFNEYLIS